MHVHVVMVLYVCWGLIGRLEKKIDEELDAEEKAKDAADTIARLTVCSNPMPHAPSMLLCTPMCV